MAANPGYNLFLKVGTTELSDHARKFSEAREERSTEVQLANGRLRKYVMVVAKEFKVTWEWLPDDDAGTADGRAGRNSLKALAADATSKTLEIKKVDDGTISSYTVFVTEYNEELIKRDYGANRAFWNISMTFKEL